MVLSARVLRTLVVGQWLLLTAGIIAAAVEDSRLPVELQPYSFTATEVTGSGLLEVGTFLCLIVATVGLLRLRLWGRWLYLVSQAVAIALFLIAPPVVATPAASFLGSLEAATVGATVLFLLTRQGREVLTNAAE